MALGHGLWLTVSRFQVQASGSGLQILNYIKVELTGFGSNSVGDVKFEYGLKVKHTNYKFEGFHILVLLLPVFEVGI